jgi:hypothetical protein
MPIRIKLTEDQVLLVRADSDEWARAYKVEMTAKKRNKPSLELWQRVC